MEADKYPPARARNPADVLASITDINIAKSETEWAAYHEIERLRAQLAAAEAERDRLRAFVAAFDAWRANLRSKVWKEKYLTRVVDARESIELSPRNP